MSAAAMFTLTIVIVIALCGCATTHPPSHIDAERVHVDGPTWDKAKGVWTFDVRCDYLAEPSRVEVLLPDDVDKRKGLRTLYVLPVEGGIGGTFGDGLATVRQANAHNRYGLICVTMSFGSVPWYGSHATDKSIRHDDYLKRVVVPLIEKHCPASGKPADRLLLGFSKSGWGGVSLLLRDPDFFGAACSWDAPLMMDERDLRWGSRRHFGTPEHAKPYMPVHLVPQRAALLAKGPPRLIILGHDIFGPHTQRFAALLGSHNIPHCFDNTLKHKHRWDSGWVPKALEMFLPGRERGAEGD